MDNKIWISSDSSGICDTCRRLLEDPYPMIQEKNLPEHICYNAMQQSTEAWASQKLIFSELSEWSITFPLPVGTKAYLKNLPKSPEMLVFANNLPFRDGEEAVFVAEFRCSDVLIVFFGLAEFVDTFDRASGLVEFFKEYDRPNGKAKSILKHKNPPENDEYIDKYTVAGCKFVVSGTNPTSRKVAEEIKKVRRWWKTFEGKKLGGNRLGSGLTLEIIKNAMKDYYEINYEFPTQEQLIKVLPIHIADTSSIRKCLNGIGIKYNELKKQIQAELPSH